MTCASPVASGTATRRGGAEPACGQLVLFFAHGVLPVEPAGPADIDVEEVEEPGLDAGGVGDGGGGGGRGGGAGGGGGAVAGQAGHHLAVRGQRLADLPLD